MLEGTKTATASAREDYDVEEEPLPEPGAMGILLDGRGRPRALVAVTSVEVKEFDQVDEDHAFAEGEGDRTLDAWRADHEAFFRAHDPTGRGFRHDMPVVLERFEVLYQE
ncbi:ASCH domain-containing protein [uncultured Friedmanniella sp.]|uniref:ASCH domain-containing protein n=1 Tax=uncultured Friedmanniella sp. TaxID=335381 RepID=UPI0035CA4D4A